MKGFADKVAVVTGGGSGIGRATALALGRAGATVEVVDRVEERVDRVCFELSDLGAPCGGHAVDCSDAEAVAEVADVVFRRRGRVDLLQNGAGILVAGPVEQIPLDQWRAVVDANLWSVVHGVRAFLPRMLEQPKVRGRRGTIVNVASFAGLVAFPYTAPYTTTKFAVVGLSEALSLELHGRGIGVTAVCPDAVRTALFRQGHVGFPRSWMRRVVEGGIDRFAVSPEAIAHAILKAARRGDPLVVPSLWLGQTWRLKRLSDDGFRRATRRLYGAVLR